MGVRVNAQNDPNCAYSKAVKRWFANSCIEYTF